MAQLEFKRFASAADAAAATASHIAGQARRHLRDADTFTVALSGGTTPRLMLAHLAGMDLPWSRVHVFQVDERVAPAGDSARNINMVQEALVVPGVLAPSNLYAMPVNAGDLVQACADYAGALTRIAGDPPALDLVHLGLGDDGHTASLVPGDAVLGTQDSPVTLTDEYRGHRRMTLTFPVLDAAAQRLWLATGADKEPMLERLARADASIPAGRVSQERSTLFTDVH